MITENDLDDMDLPKANLYEELETLSEHHLQPLFQPSQFELCTRDRRDKGIDLTYEIKRNTNHLGFRFIIQLKSTKSIKANKTNGSYSKSIDTSNINALLHNGHPAFYILFDINTKTFFYENLSDFLKYLNKKDIMWWKQASHVLQFRKKLLPDGINIIYEIALKNGLFQRNLVERSLYISTSVNNTDRISVDANFKLTDDAKIRELIENLGFELINEGRWNEILAAHKNATGNIATSARYNLILGIANYYGGSRWNAISFLKNASSLKAELNEEMQMQLQYFDNVVKYSIENIDEIEYNKNILELEKSETVGLYIKLEKASSNYIKSMENDVGENYEQYIKDIEEIISHPKANDGIKLTAKCELILFQGFKNNADYVSGIAKHNVLEEIIGVDIQKRIESAKKFIKINEAWYRNVKEVLKETIECKNLFAYHTAVINEVKVTYQFNVHSTTVFVVKETEEYPKPERLDNKPMLVDLLDRIKLSADYFRHIGHIENTIAALSTMYEIFHYINEMEKANNVMIELEHLIDDYDLKKHKKRLEFLKNNGTTHETFRDWFNSIFENAEIEKKEYENQRLEMIKMDEEEQKMEKKSTKDNFKIHLFPIGYFEFPKDKKVKVYEILDIHQEAKQSFDNMFGMVIPIANIYYNQITQEGYIDGKLADNGTSSWKNIYRIRKAFYDNQFYRFEPKF